MINQNELIIAAISIGLLAIGLLFSEKNMRLKKTGKKAKAIIFTNNYRPKINGRGGIYYPVVRFVTEDNQWITQELDFGQKPPMTEGKEVEVFYDPKNPQEVVMNSYRIIIFLPWALIIAGTCGFVLSCLELLDITNLIK